MKNNNKNNVVRPEEKEMCAKPVCEVLVSRILRYYTTLQFCGIHLLE